MKYIYLLIITFFVTTILHSQNNPSNQKRYVIVKSTFDFLKQVDRYKTSSFTKFLFNKAGFDTFLDNEDLPEDLYNNKCNALVVDVKDKSGMFITKNYIELTDCRGKLVYSSKNGSSKLKNYEKAYRESIREAFSSIQKLDSVYSSSLLALVQQNKKALVQNIQEKKKKKRILVSSVQNQVDTPKVFTKETIVKQTITSNYPLLYAQKIELGYQLINTKPTVVFVILKTRDKRKFIIKDKNGTLVNKGDYWIAEYYKGDILITESYQIKF